MANSAILVISEDRKQEEAKRRRKRKKEQLVYVSSFVRGTYYNQNKTQIG